jgi:serine/threonine-protein kinase
VALGDATDERRYSSQVTDPAPLPSPPHGVSKVDTLTDDELQRLLQPRRHYIGDVIAGRYKLVESLGTGAMGQVFIAENLGIGRRVAVKMLKPELLADALFRRRFQREAEAIGAIEHRNVARFLDLVVGDPTFLVMEYVPGPTLSAVIKAEQRLQPARAVSIARRLCWGLDAAHAAGVIHRDIKPANVILAPDPEMGEEPKLIDFGLAKVATPNPEDDLTRSGQVVGTPHYMSPEQVANRDVSARSDVYSLAAVLFHLVAGRPPFTGDDMQILYQQVHEVAPPVRRFAPEVPVEIEAVLARALDKDPGRRFASMRELARVLVVPEQRKSSGSFASGPPEVTERVRPTAPRSAGVRAPWLLAAALVGAGASAGVVRVLRPVQPASPTVLMIGSSPAGAAVEVDGVRQSTTTPLAVAGLAPGMHRVKVSHGPASLERQIRVEPAQRQIVELTLPPSSHPLQVTTAPEEANVFLDGRLVGVTPASIEVIDDDFHELRLERLGFDTAVVPIKPENRDPLLSVQLQPATQSRGTLMVSSNSPAQVWLDGVFTGLTTPTIGIDLNAGPHLVELRDSAGGRSAPRSFIVRHGETVRLDLIAPGGRTP